MDYIKYALFNSCLDNKDIFVNIGQLTGRVQFILSDRFGYLNKYSNIWNLDKTIHEVPKSNLNGNNEEFNTILEQQIKYIRNCNKKIYLLYSGGIDSSCLLSAMIMYGIEEFTIIYSKSSIEENPLLFDKIKQYPKIKLIYIDSISVDTELIHALKTGILVSGTHGDRLYGCQYYNKEKNIRKNKPYQTFLREEGFTFDLIDIITESIKFYDVNIKTAEELLVWLDFSVIYPYGQPSVWISCLPNSDNHVAPYMSLDFQKWSLAKLPGVTNVQGLDKEHFKSDMKEVIYKFTKDKNWNITKGKERSWIKLIPRSIFPIFYLDSNSDKWNRFGTSINNKDDINNFYKYSEKYKIED